MPSDDTEKALSDIHGKGGETRIPFPPHLKPSSKVKADRENGSPVSKAFPARKRLRGNGYPRIVILSGGKSKEGIRSFENHTEHESKNPGTNCP